jgi:hypothetical protein
MPEPTHLDSRDPANDDVRDIREEVDREIARYAGDTADLVLLVPEDRWPDFLHRAGCAAEAAETRYNGVTLKPGPVTAVVAQEGF